MLINATHSEELRVALVDGQKLYDLDIEVPAHEQKKSNVYKGVITRVERSLEAAFVNYGSDRHGFLPFKEITATTLGLDDPKASVKDNIKEGQELVVQVEKEERGNKGAALTSIISLAGSYLVLMPNNPGAGGISRRIDNNNRAALREVLDTLEIPEDAGIIVRTAGVGKSAEELQWDLNYLNHLWEAISRASIDRKAPYLIFQESNFIIRSIRDYLRADIDEVLIDNPSSYHLAHDFMQQVMPQYLSRVKLYEDTVPLFTRYQMESQIETAYGREVPLPSGGSIVLDHTEALTSIDINSARATKGSDFETTALNTNLEAADEIARQLRIRDMGGLFVIDFIDMGPTKNQRMVEARIKEAMKHDRARIQLSRISRFGLLEMSRQRIHSSLKESSLPVCPRCSGQGTIRSVESLSLSIVRILEEEAMKDNTARVVVQLPVDCATFILNEKRSEVAQIEKSYDIQLVIVPNKHLEIPHYEVERIRKKDASEDSVSSHERIAQTDVKEITPYQRDDQKAQQKAVVQNVMPSTPAPVQSNEKGFFGRLIEKLTPAAKVEEPAKPAPRPRSNNRPDRNRQNRPKQNDNRKKNPNNKNERNPQNRKDREKPKDNAAEQKVNKAPNPAQKQKPVNADGTAAQPRKRRRTRRPASQRPANQEGKELQVVSETTPSESKAVNKPDDKEKRVISGEIETHQTPKPTLEKNSATETTEEKKPAPRRRRRSPASSRKPKETNTSNETSANADQTVATVKSEKIAVEAKPVKDAVTEKSTTTQSAKAPTAPRPAIAEKNPTEKKEVVTAKKVPVEIKKTETKSNNQTANVTPVSTPIATTPKQPVAKDQKPAVIKSESIRSESVPKAVEKANVKSEAVVRTESVAASPKKAEPAPAVAKPKPPQKSESFAEKPSSSSKSSDE